MSVCLTILIVQLNKDSTQDVMSSHRIEFLQTRASVVEAMTPADALSKITSLIITTSEYISQKHTALYSKVIQYTHVGGAVLLGGQFCSTLNPLDFKKFVLFNWGLPWKFGVSQRTIFRINRQGPPKLQNKRIPVYYGPKAHHVKGAVVRDMVFVTAVERSTIDINPLNPP